MFINYNKIIEDFSFKTISRITIFNSANFENNCYYV